MRLAFGRVVGAAAMACALSIAPRALAEADTFGVGNGHNGDVTYTSGTINASTKLTAVNAGKTQLTVSSTTGFTAGDLVLVWQTAGLTAPTSGQQTAVTLAGTGAGAWELARIANGGVSGGNLTLTNALVGTFNPANAVEVVDVPEYHDFTINAVLSPAAYDAANVKGGLLVFFATGTVTNNSGILADGMGFTGGAATNVNKTACTGNDGTTANGFANKGTGLSALPNAGGRGDIANAGGGGDCDRAGGGGGSNGGLGGTGGNSNDSNRVVGGLGGAPLTHPFPALLVMGGGGGAGQSHSGSSPAGGAIGGGAIFIRANVITGNSSISANGASGATATSGNAAAGGGGGGGTIVARAIGAISCLLPVTATGGAGGAASSTSNGAGGGGSGGVILLQGTSVTSNCSPTVTGGAAGTSGSAGVTAGGAGVVQASIGAFCATTNQCTGGRSCDTAIGTCVLCQANTDCTNITAPTCDQTTLSCRACAAPADCTAAGLPACVTSGGKAGQCVQCAADGNCTSPTPKCDTNANLCRGCLANTDCATATKPVCDTSSKTCRVCALNNECPNGMLCDTNASSPNLGACVACVVDNDCAGTPSTPRCSPTTNTCVACLSGTDCGGTKPVCNASHACIACSGDNDCSGTTPACQTSGACGQCSAGNTSQCTGGSHVCDAPSGTCVGCNANTDCAGGMPTCNTTAHTCHACASTNDCTNAPGGPACVTVGAKIGQCVGCIDGTTCGSTTTKCDQVANKCVECLINGDCTNNQVCNTVTHACVTGCSGDTSCPKDQICDTSQVSTGACAPGCRNVLGTTNCATGKFCSKLDGTIGTCTAEPCSSDADCATNASGKKCNKGVEPHACVQCLSITDCTNNEICDQSTHTCVATAVDAGPDTGPGVTLPDASTGPGTGTKDAGAVTDGSFPNATDSGTDGDTLAGQGCSCRAAGSEADASSRSGAWLAMLASAGFFARARRKRGQRRD